MDIIKYIYCNQWLSQNNKMKQNIKMGSETLAKDKEKYDPIWSGKDIFNKQLNLQYHLILQTNIYE
ncbi:hypothetical protein ACJX0J_029076, partial [Zea mays]